MFLNFSFRKCENPKKVMNTIERMYYRIGFTTLVHGFQLEMVFSGEIIKTVSTDSNVNSSTTGIATAVIFFYLHIPRMKNLL